MRVRNVRLRQSARRLAEIVVLSSLLLTTACTMSRRPPPEPADQAAPKGVHHVVERGQTLWRIARNYGVPLEVIAEANDIEDVSSIRVGQRLFIPGVRRIVEVAPAREPSSAKPPALAPRSRKGWRWPAAGPITSRFGAPRKNRRHGGIDIDLPAGQTIYLARDGKVTFAGRREQYGLLVVVEHGGGFSSWYAHNRRLLVEKGDTLRQGHAIAHCGSTGNASGSHLHFEIRYRGRPIDPLTLLPERP